VQIKAITVSTKKAARQLIFMLSEPRFGETAVFEQGHYKQHHMTSEVLTAVKMWLTAA
jgi:hypothetical protein